MLLSSQIVKILSTDLRTFPSLGKQNDTTAAQAHVTGSRCRTICLYFYIKNWIRIKLNILNSLDEQNSIWESVSEGRTKHNCIFPFAVLYHIIGKVEKIQTMIVVSCGEGGQGGNIINIKGLLYSEDIFWSVLMMLFYLVSFSCLLCYIILEYLLLLVILSIFCLLYIL